MLTETTAELAASLSLAAARRIVEADSFMRAGLYDGWLPNLYVDFACSISVLLLFFDHLPLNVCFLIGLLVIF